MTQFRYDTFCGLYCGACDVLLANQRGTIETLARAWGTEVEQLRCHGCKSEINAVYCVDCDIKACAVGKAIDYCFQCAEYPCAHLLGFRNDEHAHHSVVLQNLSQMRRLGIEQWLAEQQVRWSCPQCTTAFSWYDQVCTACGKELYNCQDEESHIVDDDWQGPGR